MVELQNVKKMYGNKNVLDDISFEIKDGNIVGLLGKNGAGKSTLMNIMAGYLSSSSGCVYVDGFSIDESAWEVKQRIGYLPEQPPLYDAMTVEEYLYYVARLKGISKKDIPIAVNKMMEDVDLNHVQDRLIRNLSKGYRQRVGIAQAMLGEPAVLILDEPTVGLDPSQVVDLRAILREYGENHIVIISSHILTEIAEICDRVIILNEGKIVRECAVSELGNNKNRVLIRVTAKREEFEHMLQMNLSDVAYEYKGEIEKGCSDWELYLEHQDSDVRTRIFELVKLNDLKLLQMIPKSIEIEETFMDLTSTVIGKEGI